MIVVIFVVPVMSLVVAALMTLTTAAAAPMRRRRLIRLAVAEAATAAAAVVVRGPSLVDARRWRVRALRDGVVDANDARVQLHAGALLLGHFGVVSVLEVHETVATRTTSLRIRT